MTQNAKFLLVDDNAETLLGLKAALERDGLEVYSARSGAEALELLLVHDFALAIIDVHMPDMDGFELAELMRGTERCKHVPIIFATGASYEQHRVFKGYETGAVDFLFKPIDLRVLRHKADVFFELYHQRKQLALQVQERERLLEEVRNTLRLNEMFTAALGHDLRTPVSAITAGAMVIASSSQEEKSVRAARRVLSSANRIAEMIDSLLDLARARLAGGITIQRAPCDMAALAERILAEAQVEAPSRKINLSCEGNLSGAWDEGRIGQVISNLTSNAIRHGKPETPIYVQVSEHGTTEVVIVVTSEGSIPEEKLSTLFDPFRSYAEQTGSRGGLGLGLYIVDQIVRAHGGSVRVRCTDAQVTSFEVRLPRSEEVARADS